MDDTLVIPNNYGYSGPTTAPLFQYRKRILREEEVVGNIRLFSLFTPLRCLPSSLLTPRPQSRLTQSRTREEKLMVPKKILPVESFQSVQLEPTVRRDVVYDSRKENERREIDCSVYFASRPNKSRLFSLFPLYSTPIISDPLLLHRL